MDDFFYYSNIFYFGSPGDDWLSAGPGEFALVGLGGNDTLTSRWDDWEWSLGSLIGGRGNTTYYADGDITQIMDSGGNDTLYVPGYRDEIAGAFLNGRDLVLVNEWSGQMVMVLDFAGSGRIETFVDISGQRLSAQQVENLVYAEGYGNVSFAELQRLTGDYSITPQEFEHAREIDLALARLNWDNVFQHLAERGSLETNAIADAIQYEALPLLSQGAKQFWYESDAYGALVNSQFEGIADNLPLSSPRLPQRLVEDMALLYQAALDRQPDNPGLSYFVNNLRDGQSLQEVANSFYAAEEFRSQFTTFDNASYINQLYLNVLERPADQAGYDYWLTDIEQNGLSHADVLVSFAQSAENRANAENWLMGLEFDGLRDEWLIA